MYTSTVTCAFSTFSTSKKFSIDKMNLPYFFGLSVKVFGTVSRPITSAGKPDEFCFSRKSTKKYAQVQPKAKVLDRLVKIKSILWALVSPAMGDTS